MAPTATNASLSTTVISTATSTCLHVTPGKNGYLPPESCDVILYYVPSFAAAVLFCVLFGATTIIHILQATLYKKGYAWVVIMGASWELLAFVFRTLQTRHQNSQLYDILYTTFFLLAPIWINAFLYMTLGRMTHFYLPGQKLCGITARRFGLIFVLLDIVAFLVQLAGASLTTNTDGGTRLVLMGLHLYMGGIGLQEAFILGFVALTIYLHRKLTRMENIGSDPNTQRLARGSFPWRWLFYTIYFALSMITIRIIFRIGQYAQGTSATNPVVTHEAYEYVFDAVPMFLALVSLNVFHPGRILQGPESKFQKLSRAEKKEQRRIAKMKKKSQKLGISRDETEAEEGFQL